MTSSNEQQSFTNEQQAIVKESHKYVQSLHNNYCIDDGNKLARIYFNSVEKDGFCIDFDDVWALCGYSRKDHAKSKLTSKKSKLRDEIDYKILVPQVGEQTQRKWGGHTKETIMLTARGFSQFALAAQTEKGIALRDFIQFMTVRIKGLLHSIASNDVQVREPVADARPAKRLKACETQKSLMGIVKELGIKRWSAYAQINGSTNYTVTGKTKRELINELKSSGNKTSRVNARDYMSDVQLDSVSLIEKASAHKLSKERPADHIKVTNMHNNTCNNFFTPAALEFIQNQSVSKPLALRDVRKNIKAIKDDSQSKGSKSNHSILNYFRPQKKIDRFKP